MELEKTKIKELKARSKSLLPVIRIGKNRLIENTLKEIKTQLKKRRLIKIKVLNNCGSGIDDLISEVTDKCDCVLVDRIGKTFSVYK